MDLKDVTPLKVVFSRSGFHTVQDIKAESGLGQVSIDNGPCKNAQLEALKNFAAQ